MTEQTTAFRLPIRVYVEDTDAGGIVFYANYLKYMERARTELMRSLGYDKPALFDGLQFVIRGVELLYHKPAMLDDEIVVTARLTQVNRVTFAMQQQVYRDSELLAEGAVKAACIDVQSKRPRAIPRTMVAILKSHLG